MRYGEGLLDEIQRRTDIVQLIGRRVKLARKGRVFWGLCPFHKEKSPSFKVDNERRNYKCFGCGEGGSAFKWLMDVEGLSFRESVERLAGEAGVELPQWTPEDEAREQKKKSLYDVIETACAFFEQQLRSSTGAKAREYLVSRGLDDAGVKQFRLGYAPDGNTTLIGHLVANGIALEDIVAAGLARAAEDGKPARDFFYNRLMFPITDFRGRVIAFGGRALEADAKPKYINTGETSLFSKGELLYNFAPARTAALKTGSIIVAEGYMDVIALVRAGFDSAVAPLGTALTEDQLGLLWRMAPEPILSFDGDDAGFRAAQRAAKLALPALQPGHSLRFVFLPGGEDPDSFLRGQGAPAMKQLLDTAGPLADVLWRFETEAKDFATPERRAGLERSLADIVAQIRDGKIADYYRRDFENRVFNLFKRRAPKKRSDFRAYRQNGPARFQQAAETVSSAVRSSALARGAGVRQTKEMEVVGLLLEAPEIVERHGELLAALPLSDRSLDRLRNELLNLAASGFGLETGRLENHLVRAGMAGLVERLNARRAKGGHGADTVREGAGGSADLEEIEARWLAAAVQLREIAEIGPERRHAMERFKTEATEETWREAHGLLARGLPND
ncbi:MAG: DNA primase [Rhizomicrobium sp.]